MLGAESFLWVLLVLGWAVFEILRRLRQPPRPLGTIDEAAAQEPVPPAAPGRSRKPPGTGIAPPGEPFLWGSDRAQLELKTARELAIRQARRRQLLDSTRGPGRHPRRPRLNQPGALRDAMVLTTILGPCRTDLPYDGQRH